MRQGVKRQGFPGKTMAVIFVTTRYRIQGYDGHRTAPLLTRPRFLYGPPVSGTESFAEVEYDGFVPIMWVVWGVLVLILVALNVYTWRLNRDEDDQIVLDDAFSRVKDEQAEIIANVKKIEPVVRVAFWLVVAGTLFVIGYYIWDMLLNRIS